MIASSQYGRTESGPTLEWSAASRQNAVVDGGVTPRRDSSRRKPDEPERTAYAGRRRIQDEPIRG